MKIPLHRRRTAPAPPAELTETFRARIEPMLRDPGRYGLTRCTICREPMAMVGIFFPVASFAQRLGEPPGKRRLMVYVLCEDCVRLPDWQARLEAIFLEGASSSKEDPPWPV